jgi:hypothetical protein
MTLKTKFWIGAAAFFGPILIGLATPRTAPAWILHVEDGLVLAECIPLGLFLLLLPVVLVTPGRVINGVVERLVERAARRRKPAVREVPASNGIQVLGTFLDDNEDAQ